MSLSKPFFNSKATTHVRHNQNVDFMTDKEFNALHWSEQLRLKPLRDRRRWVNDTDGDYNNLIDNFDDDEEREEQ